ncbi:hypothetical protein FA95DRAFT_228405 [Auriscalpium vulgare]|uniref:Uncharacterized protein n=1 Tax=Auriscalpium vulgare TaxID=40419 RepID=A0ACB8RLJ3_9AGAM|nr:hypothetical protein FA95DRAFT_228405 [Auriscalpium vulgare]
MQPVVPLDVQRIVIEWVYRSSQHSNVDYQTLCACAIVCRAWAPIAQRMLFRRLPAFSSFMKGRIHHLVHSLHANPRLASYVYSVHINILPSTYEENWSLLILDHCPKVRSIIIMGTIDSSSWTTAFENRLRALPLNPVSLQLTGDADTVATRVVPLWPSVQVLSLYSWNMYNADDIDNDDWGANTPVRIPVPRSVRSLSIKTDFISWVLVPVAGHAVRDLAFESPGWSDRTWVTSLLASGMLPQLRSVIIEGEIPPPDVMGQLTQLRSLIFTLQSDQKVVLPQSLCHLGYHRWPGPARTEPGHLIAAVHASRNLRLLTMLSVTPQSVRAMFDDACRERDIELVFYQDHTHYPRLEVVDWI